MTIAVLRDRRFTTRCVRDAATNEEEKAATYRWYNLPFPSNNSGTNQISELDHLISLELGGADTLDNVWPQCGPGTRQPLHAWTEIEGLFGSAPGVP